MINYNKISIKKLNSCLINFYIFFKLLVKNFMEINDQKFDFKKLKEIQISFEESMKILERHVAESIANKNELAVIKNDLLEANKRFNQALNHLDDLKNSIDFENKTHTEWD